MTISPEIAVSEMQPDELTQAAELLGRAYRDNPLTIALFGDDPEVRARTNEVVFERRMASMQPAPLVVRDEGRVIGVCGFDAPGGSKMTQHDFMKVMETWEEAGPDVPQRMMSMLQEWRKRTPDEPHWNLGPVGVSVDRHGQGIGSAMVRAFCEMLDTRREPSFLETDTEKNTRLYEKFGYQIIEHVTIMDVPTWFMWRPAS
jgi:ribosomal protein S18 acetylase RimI-like enzyme